MRWFRRRRRGRHSRGYQVPVRPSHLPPAATVTINDVTTYGVTTYDVEVVRPRVELGFRDGSTQALEPGSPQSQALQDLAELLTRRG